MALGYVIPDMRKPVSPRIIVNNIWLKHVRIRDCITGNTETGITGITVRSAVTVFGN